MKIVGRICAVFLYFFDVFVATFWCCLAHFCGAFLARFVPFVRAPGGWPAKSPKDRPILEAACARNFLDMLMCVFSVFVIPFSLFFLCFFVTFLSFFLCFFVVCCRCFAYVFVAAFANFLAPFGLHFVAIFLSNSLCTALQHCVVHAFGERP